MQQDEGRALPKGALDSKSATSCTKLELAIWVYKIHKTKTQDHLGNHRAIRKVTGNSVTAPWITEHLEYLFLQSSSRIQHARTKVKKLIEKFENHKHKKPFLQDLSQTQKINKFSKESQDLIADLNNTEIFELCENSSKQQCPDCNATGK